MAARVSEGLAARDVPILFTTEANGVFAQLPEDVDRSLQARGHGYYPFGDPSLRLSRLMAAFDTTPEDVERLLADTGR